MVTVKKLVVPSFVTEKMVKLQVSLLSQVKIRKVSQVIGLLSRTEMVKR